MIENREKRAGQVAFAKGRTPTATLYRMYEYLVVGYEFGLRSEIQFCFNQPKPRWAVSAIPDPADPDPARYAVLAALPHYLVKAFNWLIERGLPRGSPAIISGEEEMDALKAQPVVLEEVPAWVAKVPPLAERLVIPTPSGDEVPESAWSEHFLEKNIVVQEPSVIFV